MDSILSFPTDIVISILDYLEANENLEDIPELFVGDSMFYRIRDYVYFRLLSEGLILHNPIFFTKITKEIPAEYRDLIDNFESGYYFIAGGFPTKLYNELDMEYKNGDMSDIDIFVLGGNDERTCYVLNDFSEKLKFLNKKYEVKDRFFASSAATGAGSGRDAKHPAAFSFGKRALSRRAGHLAKNRRGRSPLISRRRNPIKIYKQEPSCIYTFSFKHFKYPIQFIFTDKTSPMEILSSFDNSHNKCGIYRGGFYATPDAIISKETHITYFYRNIKTRRLQKALKLGMHIYGATSEKEKLISETKIMVSKSEFYTLDTSVFPIIEHPERYIYFSSSWSNSYSGRAQPQGQGATSPLARVGFQSIPSRFPSENVPCPEGQSTCDSSLSENINLDDYENIKDTLRIEWEGNHANIYVKEKTNIPYLFLSKKVKVFCLRKKPDFAQAKSYLYYYVEGIVCRDLRKEPGGYIYVEDMNCLVWIRRALLNIARRAHKLEKIPKYVMEESQEIAGPNTDSYHTTNRMLPMISPMIPRIAGFCYRDGIRPYPSYPGIYNNGPLVNNDRDWYTSEPSPFCYIDARCVGQRGRKRLIKISCCLSKNTIPQTRDGYKYYGTWGLWKHREL
jgi:hypothetical protein